MAGEKGDSAYVQDMLVAGEAVVRYCVGRTREDFSANEMLRDAVERRVEIFGEAARWVSEATQKAHPDVPWRKIQGTRHILAHDYGEVDENILWRIATEHIPEALGHLRKAAGPQSGAAG